MRNSRRLIVAVMIAASFVALRGNTGPTGATPALAGQGPIAGLLNDMRTADLASLPPSQWRDMSCRRPASTSCACALKRPITCRASAKTPSS